MDGHAVPVVVSTGRGGTDFSHTQVPSRLPATLPMPSMSVVSLFRRAWTDVPTEAEPVGYTVEERRLLWAMRARQSGVWASLGSVRARISLALQVALAFLFVMAAFAVADCMSVTAGCLILALLPVIAVLSGTVVRLQSMDRGWVARIAFWSRSHCLYEQLEDKEFLDFLFAVKHAQSNGYGHAAEAHLSEYDNLLLLRFYRMVHLKSAYEMFRCAPDGDMRELLSRACDALVSARERHAGAEAMPRIQKVLLKADDLERNGGPQHPPNGSCRPDITTWPAAENHHLAC